MRHIHRWRRLWLVGTVLLGLAAGGLLLFLAVGLSRFGLDLGDAYRILQAQHADAAAIRAAEDPITTPGGISERGFVEIGGIRQWVTLRGEDRRNPAVLILHGGPGDATSQAGYFLRAWEKVLTVVQWDQRGAGRTYGLLKDATPDMTLERMIEDGAEVARHASQRTGQDKIVILGHSWGSVLGIHLIKRHPELFAAFIGTGQAVNAAELATWSYEHTLAQLRAAHNDAAVAELLRLGPPPHRTQAEDEHVRAWTDRDLEKSDARFLLSSVAAALGNSRYTFADWGDHEKGHLAFSLPATHPMWVSLDLNTLGYDMPVPFCIIDGRADRLAPPELAAAYFQKIRAPRKAMTLVDGGHWAFMSHSGEFLQALLGCIGPQGP